MKTALVTGNLGFLGRHFHARLEGDGWRVHGADTGTARDARDVFRYWTAERIDLAVHCAAVVGGRAVIDGNPLDQAVNLELDAALFTWARRARPARIIYLSSSAAYPVHLQQARDHRPLRENDVVITGALAGPQTRAVDSLYGWCKLTGEYLTGLAQADGLPVTVVRPFSGYGTDQGTDYPFGAFLARARARQDPFTIWGDGRQVRDWIHVDDIIDGALTLADAGQAGPVNLGTGHGTSMDALALAVCDQAGYRPRLDHQPDRPSGVTYRVADTTRMDRFYTPAVSLADGIARALKEPRP